MDKFKNLIVLGPLIYAIHHFEEHIIFNFIEWKLQYFQHSAAALSTEAILSILICILVIFALLHLVKNNRASALVILFMLFATQVINAFYHIFFSFYFSDFSPGTVTAVILYLPVNFLIMQAAFKEGYLKSYFEYGCIAFLGTTTFILFEIFGPGIIGLAIIFSLMYYFYFNKKLSNNK
ncbi:HXXEE domain-containing protein [Pelagibacterales bacterium]|nr:HXXEE domain-containing protein [Pelagibacterales bacterium]